MGGTVLSVDLTISQRTSHKYITSSVAADWRIRTTSGVKLAVQAYPMPILGNPRSRKVVGMQKF